MLGPGDAAPEFSGETADGQQVRLSDLRGRPIVLYFYPKADSPGCTRESIGFAHYYPAFHDRGVEVVGVSVDSREAQSRFADRCSLPFPLVADVGKEIARQYGVLGILGMAKRITFLIDRDGRIREVVDSVLPATHVRRARDVWLAAGTASGPGVREGPEDPSANSSGTGAPAVARGP